MPLPKGYKFSEETLAKRKATREANKAAKAAGTFTKKKKVKPTKEQIKYAEGIYKQYQTSKNIPQLEYNPQEQIYEMPSIPQSEIFTPIQSSVIHNIDTPFTPYITPKEEIPPNIYHMPKTKKTPRKPRGPYTKRKTASQVSKDIRREAAPIIREVLRKDRYKNLAGKALSEKAAGEILGRRYKARMPKSKRK